MARTPLASTTDASSTPANGQRYIDTAENLAPNRSTALAVCLLSSRVAAEQLREGHRFNRQLAAGLAPGMLWGAMNSLLSLQRAEGFIEHSSDCRSGLLALTGGLDRGLSNRRPS